MYPMELMYKVFPSYPVSHPIYEKCKPGLPALSTISLPSCFSASPSVSVLSALHVLRSERYDQASLLC